MKNNLIKFAALIFTAALFTLTSCNKGDADSQSAEDAARGSYIMADAFAIASDGQGGKMLKTYALGCDTVVLFPDGGGFDVIFDDCIGDDGIHRDGIIRVTAADSAWVDESSGGISISYVDYTQDDHQISGTVTAVLGFGDITGNGINYIYFTLGANNLQITYPSGISATLNYAELNYVLKLTGVVVFGNSNGINRLGVAYTSVSEGLEFKQCPWPVKGTITISTDGVKDIIVNYDQDGNAACDNIVLVTQKRHDDILLTLD